MPEPETVMRTIYATLDHYQLTGLRDANHVVAHVDGREAVALDGSRNLITSQLNVLQHGRVKAGILEGRNGVDARRAFLEQLNRSDPNCCVVSANNPSTIT